MQYGVPQGIISSYGTVYFNDLWEGSGLGLPDGNGLLLQGVQGNDFPTIRNPISNRPQKDGAIIRRFRKGAKYIELEGLIVSSTPTYRQTLVDNLLGVTDVLLRENGTYFWTPTGASQRTHTVRLYEPVDVAAADSSDGGVTAGPKTFRFTLVAGKMDTEDDY